MIKKAFIVFLFLYILIPYNTYAQKLPKDEIGVEVVKLMKAGNIPGLSLIILNEGQLSIKSYGYSDLEKRIAVTPQSLFELGSCSKSFTALSILALEKHGKVDLNKPVSYYIPWFEVYHEGQKVEVLIKHLLHHTSGIPWFTFDLIPEGNDPKALQEVVKKIVGIELNNFPGLNYEYASINYDILGYIIEIVTGQKYEAVVRETVLNPLSLNHTSFLNAESKTGKGYKISFFRPILYNSPLYRGNMPSAYIVSNAEDMAKWLQYQMGLLESEISPLIIESHKRDESVAPHGLMSYSKGWEVSLRGDGEIRHAGLNPNFSSYIAFRPAGKIGVVVLANSNSNFTPEIGNMAIRLIKGEKIKKSVDPDTGYDKVFSTASLILSIYLLIILIATVIVLVEIIKRKRKFEGGIINKIKGITLSLFFISFVLTGIYFLPFALANLSWKTAFVWSPESFQSAIFLTIAAISGTYFIYLLALFFPSKSKYIQIIPKVLLMSILSGICNMSIILIITSSLYSNVELKYLIFYYFLALVVYLFGRGFVQVNLIKLSRELASDIRIDLMKKVFRTSFQSFEKIDRGRIYTTLNDDIGSVGSSTNIFVGLVTNVVTVTAAFLYLGTLAYWATILTITVILFISVTYYLVSRKTREYFIAATNSRSKFMLLLNGMIDGFKEISLHKKKKQEYEKDIIESAYIYRDKIALASIKFVKVFLMGECLLILVLGTVAFAIPKLFPEIELYILMGFIIILLYLIGPLNGILNSIPSVMELKVAWDRIQTFLKEIPASSEETNKISSDFVVAKGIKVENVYFNYVSNNESFKVGPINLEVKKGEVIFITGENGSGKSTLAKLLTGLYTPDVGRISIDNKNISRCELSEYYSAVFNPVTLFQKLYEVNTSGHEEEIEQYLKLFKLNNKVEIIDNTFSTVDLSSGQRKRLALLLCYLEDRPIFLFDEWAADQDPEYRKYFYKELLPEMKKQGKIVIAITHDEHYFDLADKVIKLQMGKIEYMRNNSKETELVLLSNTDLF